ncbi:MAG: hypothetical protein KA715_01355 [Xanthomonadaceae bacterium]|nr:hypothetical protein [Xanthomonadaceae bacterium]
MRTKLVISLLIIIVAGCTSKSTHIGDPKMVLKEYIQKSFSIKNINERKELEKFLVGEAKTRMSAWSEAQFYRAFVEVKREFGSLLFRETQEINANELNVVYELSYVDQNRGHDAKVTQKKMATLINRDGHWLIESVRNLKETVEFRNELALP